MAIFDYFQEQKHEEQMLVLIYQRHVMSWGRMVLSNTTNTKKREKQILFLLPVISNSSDL